MPLGEAGESIVGLAFLDRVVGRRGGVGKRHVCLALEEEAVGVIPGARHGGDVRFETGPDCRGLVAIGSLDPEQQAEAGRVGAGIFQRHLEARRLGNQRLERGRRGFDLVTVVDEGEIAVVERHEGGVGPGPGQRQLVERQPVFGKEPGGTGFAGNGGVESDQHVGLARRALELDAAQRPDGAVDGDKIERALALLLKALLDGRARAIVRGKTLVGVDGERRLLRHRRRGDEHEDRCHKGFDEDHLSFPFHGRRP